MRRAILRIRYVVGLRVLRPVLIEELIWVKDRHANAPRNETLTEREQERFWMGQLSALYRLIDGQARTTALSRERKSDGA